MRLSAIFSLLLVAATGFATFAVKYEVEGLRAQLARLKSELATEENQIAVLRAEWNYLNRPDTLAALNERYLSLLPVTVKQLDAAIADIPMREAAAAVAAAPPAEAAPPSAAAPPSPAPAVAEEAAAGAKRLTQAKTIGELIASLAVTR